MYKEYLAEFWNVIGAHYLPHSSEYLPPSSIEIVRPWFETIGYREVVPAKGTLKKSLLPPRWSKETTKGGSYKAPTSSKTGHSKKRKESSSAMDSNPSQPLVSTPVDTGMLKEHQQATSGPTSLGVTSEASANPRLSSGNDASAASIAEVNPGKSAPSDFVSQQQGMNEGTKNSSYDHLFVGTDPHVLADQTKSISEGLEIVLTQPRIGKRANSITRQVKEEEASSTIKLEDLAKLVSNVQPSFKDLDSPEDDPIIVIDDSDEDEEDEVYTTSKDTSSQTHKLEIEKNKAEVEVALLKAQPSFPDVGQLNELLVKSLQTEFLKILSAHDFSNSLLTELKDLPSKFNELTEEVKGLKKQVHELEIELPGDLKEIPSKLEDFTKIVTSLTSQVTELKTLQWELPTEFVSLLVQVLDSASSKAEDQGVPSVGQADTITNQCTKENRGIGKAEAARREGKMRKEELIDLLGPEVVNKYYNDKLQYDRYCDKMLNRRAKSRITNYDILTRKGLITLKVYREYDTSEIIPEFKANDLHLGE
ncbi:hypothetical protein Tco_0129416 [Tanacetum coccineum]